MITALSLSKRQALLMGVIFTLVSALCMAMMSVAAKHLATDISDDTILVSRFLVSLIIVMPFLLRRPQQLKCPRQHWALLITRSTTGLFSIALCFYCMRFMPVANAVLLMSSAPIFVPLLVWIMTGIKTHGPVWIGIAVSVVGVAIVLHPTHGTFNWFSIIGLLSGFFAAIAMVILRRLSKEVSANALLFYYYVVGLAILVVFLPHGWRNPQPADWWWMMAVGVFGMGYQWFLVTALKFTQIRIVAPLTLTGVVFSGMLSGIILHQVPGLWFWVGTVVTVVGIIIVINFTHRRSVVLGTDSED